MMNNGIGEGIQRFKLFALGGDSGIYRCAACIQKFSNALLFLNRRQRNKQFPKCML